MENKKNLFRIGELSKIFHLPVKTLRYYSDIGLLVPAYTDPNSGYRYYSVDQFVLIDVIRNSRRMGMSLDEISSYIKSDVQVEDIINVFNNQIEAMEQKIQEYRLITNSMKSILNTISEASSREQKIPYISEEKEQYYRSYPYTSTTVEEQEINFRKAALEGGEDHQHVYSIFGTSTLWDEYVKNGKIVNPDIRSFLPNKEVPGIQIQPEGKYVCIIFDENVHGKEKYYDKLKKFIFEKNLQPIGDFVEEWIIPRVQEGKESTLIKLKIQIKD